MSAARQKWRVQVFSWLVLIQICAALASTEVLSSPSEPIVTDPLTGLAIDGFDPVAYFTGDGPAQGQAEFEYRLGGVTWRFRNEGNRAAFVDHPEVYAPRFGGYDPVAIARGISVPGHPLTWVVVGERLYLFYDAKARTEFNEAPQRAVQAAQRRWPDVRRTLP